MINVGMAAVTATIEVSFVPLDTFEKELGGRLGGRWMSN